jgi:hypothetical protein
MPTIPVVPAGPRPKMKILDDLVKGHGTGAKMHRKLSKNKERNWLLAVTLNAFSKHASHKKLSDVEQLIVDAFKHHGFSDADIAEHGALYERLPAQDRTAFFPAKFAKLGKQSAYSMTELKKDLPGIQKAILSAPNATNIDVAAIHAGKAHLNDFPVVRPSVMREYGTSVLRAVEPNVTPPNPHYTIKATRFRCNDETGWDWTGSDEPYWIFGSLGSGTAVTTRSHVFGDVDSGDSRTFESNEGCIWGQNCLAQDLPAGEIGSLISLWEHDYGNPDTIKAGVAAAFAAAAAILAATGVAAWVAAVVAGVGAVIQWLLGFMDDDHIADQTIVFTREVIESQLTKTGQMMNVVRRFTDGDGDYTLTVQVTRFA